MTKYCKRFTVSSRYTYALTIISKINHTVQCYQYGYTYTVNQHFKLQTPKMNVLLMQITISYY